MSQRLRRPWADLALAGPLILWLGSCTRDEPERPSNGFPVRLFTVPEFSRQRLLEAPLTAPVDLEGWWILTEREADSQELQPAAGHFRIDPEDGLTLAPGDPPLLRLMEIPAGAPLTLEASLAQPLARSDDRRSNLLQFFPLGALERTGSLEQVLRSQQVGLPSGKSSELASMVAFRLAAIRAAPSARLSDEQSALLEVTAPREPELRILALIPGEAPRSFRSLRVFQEPSRDPALRAREPHREVVAGEERVVVRIAPGGSHRSSGRPPRGTRWFSYGLALEEGSRFARDPLVYSLRVLQGNRELLRKEERIERWDSQADPFLDRDLDWPGSADPDLPVEVIVENQGAVALMVAQPLFRGPATDERPNLLLISLDTLRADHLSGSGYPRPTSPFLDRLAAESVFFENYQAVASHTLPTHVSMLTGLLPIQHRVTDLSRRLEAHAIPFLPALLADHGYATAAFTGGGFVSAAFGLSHGFDQFTMIDPLVPEHGLGLLPKRAQPGRQTLEDVSRWIESRHSERWFAFVHTYAIHNYFAPKPIVEQFDRQPKSAWRGDLALRLNPPYWRIPEQAPGPEDLRHLVDLYDATIRYVDQELERFFLRLESQGLLRNTLVVVTSDHGEEFWEHGGLQHSLTLFEEQLDVLLIIRRPGSRSGMRVQAPMSQADLAPTLLDLMDLRSQLPDAQTWPNSRAGLLIDSSSEAGSRTPFLAQIELEDARSLALRQGDLKILWGDTSDTVLCPARREWELYDLKLDPHETDDLALKNPALLEETRQRLTRITEEWGRFAHAASSRSQDGSVLEQLRALGYGR